MATPPQTPIFPDDMQFDHYDIVTDNYTSETETTLYTPKDLEERTKNYLTDKEAYKALHHGGGSNSRKKRETLKELFNYLDQHPELLPTKVQEKRDALGDSPSIADRLISAEDLLDIQIPEADHVPASIRGKNAKNIYQDALTETYNSRAFRNAVFLASRTTINSRQPKGKRFVMWFAGASGLGKSYTSKRIKHFFANLLNLEFPRSDNDVGEECSAFFVDGGFERVLCEPKAMLDYFARTQNLLIKDREKIEPKNYTKIKKLIWKACDKQKLNLIIVETFSKIIKPSEFNKIRKKMKQYAQEENTLQLFGKITGDKNAVKVQGVDRAYGWEQPKETFNPKKRSSKEGKPYKDHFKAGVRGTSLAE